VKTSFSSRIRSRGKLRAAAAMLLCAAAALVISAPAGAAERSPETGGLGALGRTVLAAVATATHTDAALGSLGDGLAMMEARRRIEARAATAANAPAEEAPETPPIPIDPSKMPPASAGSNGTAVKRHSAADGEKIFAHTRAGGDGSTSILLTGIALPPPDAPQAVKDVVNNANMIVGRPYVWGGGHGSFYSSGYDCSGSVSFALFGGGLIPEPLTSSSLEGWGAPGPGKWITVYANAGHTFAEIAGLRWDTVGDEQGTGPRWHLAPASGAGFVVRHPPGY
jgi:cell wall-associated NlpC family hydrolase